VKCVVNVEKKQRDLMAERYAMDFGFFRADREMEPEAARERIVFLTEWRLRCG
jgi:hypothetical protein